VRLPEHFQQAAPSSSPAKVSSLFYVAFEQYLISVHADAVREAVNATVQAYEEAVATATHAYKETLGHADPSCRPPFAVSECQSSFELRPY
jgi:hypothetical protein